MRWDNNPYIYIIMTSSSNVWNFIFTLFIYKERVLICIYKYYVKGEYKDKEERKKEKKKLKSTQNQIFRHIWRLLYIIYIYDFIIIIINVYICICIFFKVLLLIGREVSIFEIFVFECEVFLFALGPFFVVEKHVCTLWENKRKSISLNK